MRFFILFHLFIGLTLFMGPLGVNAFAQNISEQTNQTGETTITGINDSDNVTGGLIGIANGTGEIAGNITRGLGDAVNQTGQALSNTTIDTIEGIHDLVNGSGK